MRGVRNSALSLTPDFSQVCRAVNRDETVSTVFIFPATSSTPLKRGVAERRLA